MLLKEHTITDFVDITASKEPAPGGGSIAALSGALSSALTAMVNELTKGKIAKAISTIKTGPAIAFSIIYGLFPDPSLRVRAPSSGHRWYRTSRRRSSFLRLQTFRP